MAKMYTGKGDDGTTGLLGEGRVNKYDLRMECLGTLDELSASLGLARSLMDSDVYNTEIVGLQRKLYELMAEIAATPENAEKFSKITEATVDELEKTIDTYTSQMETPIGFIIPGDLPASAAISVSRAITRRAERRVTELFSRGDIQNPAILKYLNRLSSLLFVLEVKLIQEASGVTLTYAKGKKG